MRLDPNNFRLLTGRKGLGLLVRLDDSELFCLNSTAALIWSYFLRGNDVPQIAKFLSVDFAGVEPKSISAALEEVATPRRHEGAPAQAVVPDYESEPTEEDGLLVRFRGRPVVEVRPKQRQIRFFGLEGGTLQQHVAATAPKAFASVGYNVFHGAAVISGDGVVVISGDSGAGKSTFTNECDRLGLRKLSDDKLFLDCASLEQPCIFRKGEDALRVWSTRMTQAIGSDGRGTVDLAIEPTNSLGDPLPIKQMLFLDSRRRDSRSRRLSLEEVTGSEAAKMVLAQQFLAKTVAQDLDRSLSCTIAILEFVKIFAATVPDGIEMLSTAVKDYIGMTTS